MNTKQNKSCNFRQTLDAIYSQEKMSPKFCFRFIGKGDKKIDSFFYLDHLILHLELHFQASRCGGLPSLLSGSAPAITHFYINIDAMMLISLTYVITLRIMFAILPNS